MFIDLIIGFIAGLILSRFSDTQANVVMASLAFSILPDLDFLIYHAFHPIDRFSHKHRRILHLPLLYIPLGILVLRLFNSDFIFYTSFVILSLYHFLHDTFPVGWGIQWLYPFTNKHFVWYEGISTSEKVFGNLHSDSPKNIDAHADIHGDDDWAKKSFFK